MLASHNDRSLQIAVFNLCTVLHEEAQLTQSEYRRRIYISGLCSLIAALATLVASGVAWLLAAVAVFLSAAKMVHSYKMWQVGRRMEKAALTRACNRLPSFCLPLF